MKRLVIPAIFGTSLALAAGWTGTLFDADCRQPGNPSACPVTAYTRHFGVARSSRVYYLLSEEGDVKVQAALADRQKQTGKLPEGSNVRVWFTGKPDGHKLQLNDFALK